MKEDFTKRGEHYDIIFDAVGKYNKSLCTDALMPNGKYVSVNGMMAKVSKEDMNLLKQLAETEKLKPVIDRTYRLEEIAEAHIYVEKGHKRERFDYLKIKYILKISLTILFVRFTISTIFKTTYTYSYQEWRRDWPDDARQPSL